MISKKQKIIAVSLAAAAALGISVAAAYDSSEDPIISLSYLVSIFKPELMEDINAKIEEEVEKRVEQLRQSGINTGYEQPPAAEEPKSEDKADVYDIVSLTYGDCLYALGSCDIMLRAGSAYCIAPDPTQGLSDYTSGLEVYNREYLIKNHMCLIPRGDGRGIFADSESVYVMIRGEYTIVKG